MTEWLTEAFWCFVSIWHWPMTEWLTEAFWCFSNRAARYATSRAWAAWQSVTAAASRATGQYFSLLCIRGGILPHLRGFSWNRNWNPWLMTIIFRWKKNRRKKKPPKKTKQSESVFGLSHILSHSQVIPGCARAVHCCLAFKNGHANRHHHSRQKFRWNRSEE